VDRTFLCGAAVCPFVPSPRPTPVTAPSPSGASLPPPPGRETPPLPPALVLGAAVVAFSWAGPLIRFTDAAAVAVAAWRLLLSVAFLAAVVTFRRDGWAPLARLQRREWGLAVGAGVLLALHFWSWIASIQFTTVASSVVLVSTQPLFVALLSVLYLREHPRRGEWVGMGIAVAGAAWIGWGDMALGPAALLGDGLALGAAFLAAAYYVVGRSLRRKVDLWSYVTVVYGAAAVTLTLAVLATPGVPLVRGYGTGDWLVFLALAAGPMMIGHTGVNYALRYVRAYLANLAVLGEPVGATLIAWLLPAIAETPSVSTLVGGALILLGVGVALRAR
jgi:drug/metabolite transporter (DMT)-like permease